MRAAAALDVRTQVSHRWVAMNASVTPGTRCSKGAWSINVCSVCWARGETGETLSAKGLLAKPSKKASDVFAGLRLPQVLRRCLMLLSLLQSNLKDLAGLLTRRSGITVYVMHKCSTHNLPKHSDLPVQLGACIQQNCRIGMHFILVQVL